MNRILTSKVFKGIVFLACLAPVATLVWAWRTDNLTANPIEYITRATGDWTLRFLVITLAITPFRKIPGFSALIRHRRMVGLFAFFYGSMHFATYIWLDKFFDFGEMWKDVMLRRFITVGFAAFVLMIPLAVTSTAGWIRRLGGRRWQWLHRLIYVSAICGVVHYYWLVKSDTRKPLQYAWMVGILLAWRVGEWMYARRRGARGKRELVTAEGIAGLEK